MAIKGARFVVNAQGDLSHHLWVFGTASGGAVPKTLRFCTQASPNTTDGGAPLSETIDDQQTRS